MTAKRGARVLGPYPNRGSWRVVEIDARGKRSSVHFDKKHDAERHINTVQSAIARGECITQIREKRKDAVSRIAAFKIYAVRADGSEAMLVHDVLPSDFETYDIDINGAPFGVWVQKLTAAQIADREHDADRLSRDVAEGRIPF